MRRSKGVTEFMGSKGHLGPLLSGVLLAALAGCGTSAVESPPRTRTSAVSCSTPPTFAGLALVSSTRASTCGAQLTWAPATASCGGAITYSVYRGTSSGFTPSAANMVTTGLTATSFTDRVNVQDNQTYWYVVRATETAGGTIEESNTVTRSVHISGPVVPAVRYVDDFDGNRPQDAGTYWTTSGGTFAIANSLTDGGVNNAYEFPVTQYGYYPPDTSATLTLGGDGSSPGINGFQIPSRATRVELTCSEMGYVEGGYDFLNVLSRSGAAGPWRVLGTRTGDLGPEDISFNPQELQAAAGQPLWFAWNFTSDSVVEFQAPYLDNVRLEVDTETACMPYQPPPGVAAGYAIAGVSPATPLGSPVAVTVRAVDSTGAPVASYSGFATVSSSDTHAAVTTPITFIDGVASASVTFATLGDQWLTIRDPSNPTLSGTVTTSVVPAPDHLAVLSQPTDVTAGAAFGTPLQVGLFDAAGNPISTDGIAIVLSLSGNPTGDTLSGTRTQTTVGGVAAFSDLALHRASAGDEITAVVPGLASVTTAPISVTAGPAHHLAFSSAPSSATAGAVLSPAVMVTAFDAFDNVADQPVTVRMSLGSNPDGASLSGTTAQVTTAGVASFGDLAVDRPGLGYSLFATADGLPAINSVPFDVAVSNAAGLAFSNGPPATVVAGAPFGVQVTLRDGLGNPVTGGAPVTVSLTLLGDAALSGTSSVDAVNGVATFTGLSVTQAGSGLTLRASASGFAVGSSAFSVVNAAASTLAIEVGSPARQGQPLMVTVTARDAFGNIARDDQRTITFSSSDAKAQLPAPVALYDGRAQTTVVFGSSGGQTITASDSQDAAISGTQSVAVSAVSAPTITLLTPNDGATVSGTVAVIASGTVGAGTSIASVSVTVDGASLATGSSAVLSASWDATQVDASKPHVLVASVVDAAGNTASSAPVTVKVTAPAHTGCSATNGQSAAASLGLLALFQLVILRRRRG